MIQYLLKKEGMTILGVKNILKLGSKVLDVNNDDSLRNNVLNKNLKSKAIKLLQKIKKIKIMAKKSHLKVRMVPESNPDSKFIYYAKKPTKGEKAKEKLKLKKYNPNTRKHEYFVEKKLPPHSK